MLSKMMQRHAFRFQRLCKATSRPSLQQIRSNGKSLATSRPGTWRSLSESSIQAQEARRSCLFQSSLVHGQYRCFSEISSPPNEWRNTTQIDAAGAEHVEEFVKNFHHPLLFSNGTPSNPSLRDMITLGNFAHERLVGGGFLVLCLMAAGVVYQKYHYEVSRKQLKVDNDHLELQMEQLKVQKEEALKNAEKMKVEMDLMRSQIEAIDHGNRETRKIMKKKLNSWKPEALLNMRGDFVERDDVRDRLLAFVSDPYRHGLNVYAANGCGKSTVLAMLFSCLNANTVSPEGWKEIFKDHLDEYLVVQVNVDAGKDGLTGDEIRKAFGMPNEPDLDVGRAIAECLPDGKKAWLYVNIEANTPEVYKYHNNFSSLFRSARFICEGTNGRLRYLNEISKPLVPSQPTSNYIREMNYGLPLWDDRDVADFGKERKNGNDQLEFPGIENDLDFVKKVGGQIGTLTIKTKDEIEEEWKEKVARFSDFEKKEVLKKFYDKFFVASEWDGRTVIKVSEYGVEEEWKELFDDSIIFDRKAHMYVCQDRVLKGVLDEVLGSHLPGFKGHKLAAEGLPVKELPAEGSAVL